MFDHLKKQFQKRTVEKEYLVLVHGVMDNEHDSINFAIDRGKDGRMVSRPKTDRFSLRTVMKIQPGKEALTEYWVEKKFTRFSLLRVKIYTGRTHQIRVHLLAFNHSVVGDKLYFNKKLNRKRDEDLGRLFLHSAKLCFLDLDNKSVCFNSNLPAELKSFLAKLK
jgi:23S rRNA-/tRNA-specific pseudouridylate synthase